MDKIVVELERGETYLSNLIAFNSDNIGNDIFLTREEAEKKILEERL